jgi:hypothetical protein
MSTRHVCHRSPARPMRQQLATDLRTAMREVLDSGCVWPMPGGTTLCSRGSARGASDPPVAEASDVGYRKPAVSGH